MKVRNTFLEGVCIIEPDVFFDSRGYFFESYNEKKFLELNLKYKFVQDNQSKSSYGVIRGLHYQIEPYAQTKLVRVICGKIFDVAVDIRKNSPTYGKWFGIELSDENNLQLLIPKGFAHGFSVLSDYAIVLYKCDEFYHKELERGIIYNDPYLNINWQVPDDKVIVSQKDNQLPDFQNAEINFYYNN